MWDHRIVVNGRPTYFARRSHWQQRFGENPPKEYSRLPYGQVQRKVRLWFADARLRGRRLRVFRALSFSAHKLSNNERRRRIIERLSEQGDLVVYRRRAKDTLAQRDKQPDVVDKVPVAQELERGDYVVELAHLPSSRCSTITLELTGSRGYSASTKGTESKGHGRLVYRFTDVNADESYSLYARAGQHRCALFEQQKLGSLIESPDTSSKDDTPDIAIPTARTLLVQTWVLLHTKYGERIPLSSQYVWLNTSGANRNIVPYSTDSNGMLCFLDSVDPLPLLKANGPSEPVSRRYRLACLDRMPDLDGAEFDTPDHLATTLTAKQVSLSPLSIKDLDAVHAHSRGDANKRLMNHAAIDENALRRVKTSAALFALMRRRRQQELLLRHHEELDAHQITLADGTEQRGYLDQETVPVRGRAHGLVHNVWQLTPGHYQALTTISDDVRNSTQVHDGAQARLALFKELGALDKRVDALQRRLSRDLARWRKLRRDLDTTPALHDHPGQALILHNDPRLPASIRWPRKEGLEFTQYPPQDARHPGITVRINSSCEDFEHIEHRGRLTHLTVHSGTWRLFSGLFESGSAHEVTPGQYSLLKGPMPLPVRSIQMVKRTPAPKIMQEVSHHGGVARIKDKDQPLVVVNGNIMRAESDSRPFGSPYNTCWLSLNKPLALRLSWRTLNTKEAAAWHTRTALRPLFVKKSELLDKDDPEQEELDLGIATPVGDTVVIPSRMQYELLPCYDVPNPMAPGQDIQSLVGQLCTFATTKAADKRSQLADALWEGLKDLFRYPDQGREWLSFTLCWRGLQEKHPHVVRLDAALEELFVSKGAADVDWFRKGVKKTLGQLFREGDYGTRRTLEQYCALFLHADFTYAAELRVVASGQGRPLSWVAMDLRAALEGVKKGGGYDKLDAPDVPLCDFWHLSAGEQSSTAAAFDPDKGQTVLRGYVLWSGKPGFWQLTLLDAGRYRSTANAPIKRRYAGIRVCGHRWWVIDTPEHDRHQIVRFDLVYEELRIARYWAPQVRMSQSANGQLTEATLPRTMFSHLALAESLAETESYTRYLSQFRQEDYTFGGDALKIDSAKANDAALSEPVAPVVLYANAGTLANETFCQFFKYYLQSQGATWEGGTIGITYHTGDLELVLFKDEVSYAASHYWAGARDSRSLLYLAQEASRKEPLVTVCAGGHGSYFAPCAVVAYSNPYRVPATADDGGAVTGSRPVDWATGTGAVLRLGEDIVLKADKSATEDGDYHIELCSDTNANRSPLLVYAGSWGSGLIAAGPPGPRHRTLMGKLDTPMVAGGARSPEVWANSAGNHAQWCAYADAVGDATCIAALANGHAHVWYYLQNPAQELIIAALFDRKRPPFHSHFDRGLHWLNDAVIVHRTQAESPNSRWLAKGWHHLTIPMSNLKFSEYCRHFKAREEGETVDYKVILGGTPGRYDYSHNLWYVTIPLDVLGIQLHATTAGLGGYSTYLDYAYPFSVSSSHGVIERGHAEEPAADPPASFLPEFKALIDKLPIDYEHT